MHMTKFIFKSDLYHFFLSIRERYLVYQLQAA